MIVCLCNYAHHPSVGIWWGSVCVCSNIIEDSAQGSPVGNAFAVVHMHQNTYMEVLDSYRRYRALYWMYWDVLGIGKTMLIQCLIIPKTHQNIIQQVNWRRPWSPYIASVGAWV